MCRRCDSCAWFLAGLQEFSASCPGSDLETEKVHAYQRVEDAENWVREAAPYSYGHRARKCETASCCEKINVAVNGVSSEFYFRYGVYKDESGRSLRRVENALFQGWELQHFRTTLLSATTWTLFTCPSHADNWFDKTGKKFEDVKIKCADPQVGKWSEWSNWSSDCSCRFRGTYRERNCNSSHCKGNSVEVRPCKRRMNCSDCCGEIEVRLPDVDEFRKSPELSMVDSVFYLTEHQDNGKPIYEAKNGNSFLRPYTNMFWIVTKDIRSADFIYFNEDSSICPSHANQLKWNYKAGSSTDYNFLKDNRIQFVCKSSKTQQVSEEDEYVKTTVKTTIKTTVRTTYTRAPSNPDKCCKKLEISIPLNRSPGDYAGEYSLTGAELYTSQTSVRALVKTGSYWALAQTATTNSFKMYHPLESKCPEKAEKGKWKVLSGGTWMTDENITVSCKSEETTTQTTQTTQKSTTPATTMTTTQRTGCCRKIVIDRGDGTPSYNLERNESMDYGWYSPATKHTFTVTGNYAVLGFEYSVSQVACYATVSTSETVCPTLMKLSWKCLSGGWNSAPNLTIKCDEPQTTTSTTRTTTTTTTTTTTQTTTVATTSLTTTTTTTTTKRNLSFGTTPKLTTTQRVTLAKPSTTAEGCCKRLVISRHGVKDLPTYYKVEVADTDDTKWKNDGYDYTVHWENRGTSYYWVFGKSYDIGKVKCYISLTAADIATNNCPERMPQWNCFEGGWKETDMTVECEKPQELPQIAPPTLPTVSRPNTTPRLTSPVTTTSTSTTTIKKVAQKRNENGCCSVLESTWSGQPDALDQRVVGKFQKVFGFYRKENDARVELKIMETYVAVLVNGRNLVYGRNETTDDVKCPEDIASWRIYANNEWTISNKFVLKCPTSQDSEYEQVVTNSVNDDYELVDFTTTEATTTTEWTTTPWTTRESTVTSDPGVWAPWSSCSSTCKGIQTRSRFDSSVPEETRPCGNDCPVLSNWFEWSPCSAWCGMGTHKRRRLCVKGQQLSNECTDKKEDRFEEKTCYLRPCPMVDPKNCCQAITVTTQTPNPYTGVYLMTSSSDSVKYKHANAEFFVFLSDNKWQVGPEDSGITSFTIMGKRNRGHCPTPITDWAVVNSNGESSVTVECGVSWSEWADSGKDNRFQCGDRFQTRRRIDDLGLTEEETRNIGEPCDACGLENNSEKCDVYAASGYCNEAQFEVFMQKTCPRSCCVYTGNYSFQ